MRLLRRALRAVLLLAVPALGVGLYFVAYPNLPEYEAPEALHYLEQWDATQRQTYYYTPQGTQVKGLEYDWFRALERPFSRDRFATPDYLARFGFLVDPAQKATALNPGNLPVGFARHEDDETGRAYLDVTCAACHTGELRYQGQAIRIDGGAAMHSLASTVPTLRGGAFGQALGMSMAFTYYNPLKFRRFAEQVLGATRNCATTSSKCSTGCSVRPTTTGTAGSTPPKKASAAPMHSAASPTACSATPSIRRTTAWPTRR